MNDREPSTTPEPITFTRDQLTAVVVTVDDVRRLATHPDVTQDAMDRMLGVKIDAAVESQQSSEAVQLVVASVASGATRESHVAETAHNVVSRSQLLSEDGKGVVTGFIQTTDHLGGYTPEHGFPDDEIMQSLTAQKGVILETLDRYEASGVDHTATRLAILGVYAGATAHDSLVGGLAAEELVTFAASLGASE
ncbi:MAG TPA: hypothetical protein VMB52_00725 [Verrucomicrobiae bacterium]|nr:hypothetical protein [Verrucomicrobiae bacterium]